MTIPLFLTYLAACIPAALTGMMFQPGAWYDGLRKPSWTPKPWVFPVVWTALYLMMALAGARLAATPGGGTAQALWSVQIAFNVVWTPVFFGLHKMRAGMVVILGLWAAVAATTWAAFGVDWVAGLLLAPYLLWVTIASALNYKVMTLNPTA